MALLTVGGKVLLADGKPVNAPSGGGGGEATEGFSITFPDEINFPEDVLVDVGFSQGTAGTYTIHSLRGTTLNNVIVLRVRYFSGQFWVARMTLQSGVIGTMMGSGTFAFWTTKAPNSTPTPMASASSLFYFILSDVVLSSLVPYNTD